MPTLRPYRSSDLDALYAISLATGDRGGDASHLYSDPKLMGHIYSAPYAMLRPDLVRVVEDDEGVAGFVLGALDTQAWEASLEDQWWPQLRARYRLILTSGEPSPDARRIAMIHRPDHAPREVASGFPAHLHLNLLPRLQGRGWGRGLAEAWLELATKAGAIAVHVAPNRANPRAVGFWTKMGFVDVTPPDRVTGRTIWLGRGDAHGV
jgi:GNAT superfamily N-acetyltransferase